MEKLYDHFLGFYPLLISHGADLLKTATEIYLIGYRAQDPIIRDMFASVNRDALLHVIGLEDAPSIAANIQRWVNLTKEIQVYTGGFEGFVKMF